ncbi:hypothetical protein GE09DRAFT_1070250 [Coniochaeta sp. 2T2.1]|nr:hypothetical protein GE09DRAFT_1070250 [Coniochaeta sp. 2T2.1]
MQEETLQFLPSGLLLFSLSACHLLSLSLQSSTQSFESVFSALVRPQASLRSSPLCFLHASPFSEVTRLYPSIHQRLTSHPLRQLPCQTVVGPLNFIITGHELPILHN